MSLRALRIQLDPPTAQPFSLPDFVQHEYLGGRGIAVWLLSHQLPEQTSPRSKANFLIFSTGPLAGSGIVGTGGFTVSSRSPLTGAIGHSWAEGHWGAALRRAGYDLMLIEGQSADWCYIQVDGERVTIRPAGDLIGLDTITTERVLRRALGSDYSVVCLGPAGEAGVAYATMVAEGRFSAAPAGPGAVMAHKRVKAIAVRGNQPIALADGVRAQSVVAAIEQRATKHPFAAEVKRWGSAAYLVSAIERGAISVRNGQDASAASLATLAQLSNQLGALGQRDGIGCEGCPLQCHGRLMRSDGSSSSFPSLEALVGFGARCEISSIEQIVRAQDLCVRLGLDVTATSAALAFMSECQEQGLSKSEPLPWGDADNYLAAIERLGQRRERRDILSLGVGEMQEVFFGSSAFAPQIGGQAMSPLDPRGLPQLALSLATSPIGGDLHYAMGYSELLKEPPAWIPDDPNEIKRAAARVVWHERFAATIDAMGICRQLGLMAYQISPAEAGELLVAALGRTLSGPEVARAAERIISIERWFGQKYGTTHQRDGLPKRWSQEPLNNGPSAGQLPPLTELLAEYYRRHGCDERGVALPKRMADLNILL